MPSINKFLCRLWSALILTCVLNSPLLAGPPSLVGKQFPQTSLATPTGERVDLQTVRDELPAIITLTTSWCADCKTLENTMKQIRTQLATKKIKEINIYVGQPPESLRKLTVSSCDSRPEIILLDQKRQAALGLGLSHVPYQYFVDASGLVKRQGSFLEKENVLKAAEALCPQP